MAQQLITDQQVLGSNTEATDIERKRRLAELLAGESLDQPKGQLISGHYVAPSWSQMLNPVAKAVASTELQKSANTSQTAMANALRGKKATETKEISDAIQAKDWNKASSLIAASETGAGQEYKPLLAKFLVPEQLSEKDKEDIRLREAQIKAQEKHYGQIATQHAQSLAQSRVPMGYRLKQDGALEAIPGGPADQKAQNIDTGRQTVSTLIDTLKSQYDILKESGGIVSTKSSALSNAPSALASSDFGQSLGKTFGTQNQSARNTISQSKPILLQAISKALGVSSKQLDSNRELQLYLDAVSNPKLDYETNIGILSQLAELYGANGSAPPIGNNSGGSNVPSVSDIDAEIARRKKK
jgi:hypothetical protein